MTELISQPWTNAGTARRERFVPDDSFWTQNHGRTGIPGSHRGIVCNAGRRACGMLWLSESIHFLHSLHTLLYTPSVRHRCQYPRSDASSSRETFVTHYCRPPTLCFHLRLSVCLSVRLYCVEFTCVFIVLFLLCVCCFMCFMGLVAWFK